MKSPDDSTAEHGARARAHSLGSILARLAPSRRFSGAAPQSCSCANDEPAIDDDLLQRIDFLACLFGDEDTKP